MTAYSRIRRGSEGKAVVISLRCRTAHLEVEEKHSNTYSYKSRPLAELGLEFRNSLPFGFCRLCVCISPQ